jgi:O-antigen ligase
MNSNYMNNSIFLREARSRLVAILALLLGGSTILGLMVGAEWMIIGMLGMLFVLFLVLRPRELFAVFPLVTLFSYYYLFSLNISPEKILLLLVFGVWLVTASKRAGHWPNRFPQKIALAFGIYIFFNFLSFLLNSFFIDLTISWLISLILRGLTVYIVYRTVSQVRLLQLSIIGLSTLTLVMFVWMIYTIIVHNDLEFFRLGHINMPKIYSYTVLIQPNITSLYGVILFPIMFTCALASDRTWQRFLFYIFSGMAFGITLMTLSRSGIVDLLAIGIFFAWVFRLRFQVIFLVVILLLGVSLMLLNMPYLSKSIDRTLTGQDISSYTRIDLIRVVWSSFLENPLLGHGPGSFRYLTIKHNSLFRNSASFLGNDSIAAHSDLTMILAETGIAGLGTFIFCLYQYIRRAWHDLCFLHDRKLKLIYIGCLASLMGVAVDSLFHQVLIHNILWFLIGLVLAIPNIHKLTLQSREKDKSVNIGVSP